MPISRDEANSLTEAFSNALNPLITVDDPAEEAVADAIVESAETEADTQSERIAADQAIAEAGIAAETEREQIRANAATEIAETQAGAEVNAAEAVAEAIAPETGGEDSGSADDAETPEDEGNASPEGTVETPADPPPPERSPRSEHWSRRPIFGKGR